MNKPRIFLGSSGKQTKLLQAIKRGLEDVADVESWTTTFNPGRSTLDRLVHEPARLAMVLQLTLPGAPCIYYGDVIGMAGDHDPDNRRAYPADPKTALFHLLNMLEDASCPRPAAIIGCPVGFVGAAESKAVLMADPPAPALTVAGRLGGSAITVAAVNALASRSE